MIGVFDSGAGGRFALAELRRLCKNADITYLADEKNAPFGEKSERELELIVKEDLEYLYRLGADRILIACCTASAVWDRLPKGLKEISIPIVKKTAELAKSVSPSGKIGVISTAATMRLGAFAKEIPSAISVAAPKLVSMAESGFSDKNITDAERRIIEEALLPLRGSGIDTLILGCTHFAYFEGEIERTLGVRTVNSARVAAELAASLIPDDGEGRTVCFKTV